MSEQQKRPAAPPPVAGMELLEGATIEVSVNFPGKVYDGTINPSLRHEDKDLRLFDAGRFLELVYTHPQHGTVHRRRVPWVHIRAIIPQGGN